MIRKTRKRNRRANEASANPIQSRYMALTLTDILLGGVAMSLVSADLVSRIKNDSTTPRPAKYWVIRLDYTPPHGWSNSVHCKAERKYFTDTSTWVQNRREARQFSTKEAAERWVTDALVLVVVAGKPKVIKIVAKKPT